MLMPWYPYSIDFDHSDKDTSATDNCDHDYLNSISYNDKVCNEKHVCNNDRFLIALYSIFTTTEINTETIISTTSLPESTTSRLISVTKPTPIFNGLTYYTYTNNYDFNQVNPGYDVTTFKNTNYDYTGSVRNPPAFACSDTSCNLPGSGTVVDYTQLTAVMQGYVYAATSGTYTFTTGTSGVFVDNYLGLWLGDKAYSDWTNNNADFAAVRTSSGSVPGTYTTTMVAGELRPITLIFINGGGPASFNFQIITPDGTVHGDTSGFFVQACGSGSAFTP